MSVTALSRQQIDAAVVLAGFASLSNSTAETQVQSQTEGESEVARLTSFA